MKNQKKMPLTLTEKVKLHAKLKSKYLRMLGQEGNVIERYPDSFKEYVINNLLPFAEDLEWLGLEIGIGNLNRYVETMFLYSRYGDEIWEILDEQFKDKKNKYKNILEMLSDTSFANFTNNHQEFMKLIVHFAIRSILQGISK